MPIISASRRTDIPAFYSEWLVNRLRAGYCHWINPYSKEVYRVSLTAEDCPALVFWTRNPNPLIRHLPELDARGYKYYFLVTITGYPREIEPRRPDLDTAIRAFQALSDRLSPDAIVWRYDPIVMSSMTGEQYHLDQFQTIARQLQGYTPDCTYSFISMYGKTQRNLDAVSARTGITFASPEVEERHALLRQMVGIARDNRMQMLSCCMEDYQHVEGIQQSSCIGLPRLQKVTGDPNLLLKAKPTREFCGCVASVDIGSYDTCLFGCAYCYATNTREIALGNHAAHDPQDTILLRPDALSGVDLDTLVKPLPGDPANR